MNQPLIFDIKRASTSDGPGVRTVIFFKGCNLDCFWCHNPEGKSPKTQLAFFKEKCVSCGACRNVCGNGKCTACGKCAEVCCTNARKIYGKKYSPKELLDFIKADKPYFDATDGGVTFSGGECMLYPDFLACIAEMCRQNGISVAVDTAGCVPYENFEKVMPYTDIFLYDIKALDPVLHKKGTGKDNRLVLQNLEHLIDTGKRIIIRTPVIPGFNEGEEAERIKKFCAESNLPHEMLPYHEFGEGKKKALEKFSENV